MRHIKIGNIPNYPEYFITKNGKLYSKWSGKWKLKSSKRIKNNGYSIQTLHNHQGDTITIGLHQLVAQVYIPNPNNKPCVCHKDNNRTHNHYKNLYWGTNKENTQQMVLDGRHYVPPSKLSWITILNLLEDRFSKGIFIKDLARIYDLSPVTVIKYLKKYEEDFKAGRL